MHGLCILSLKYLAHLLLKKKKISILASPKLKLGCWISNQFLGLNGQKFKTANVQINMAQEEKKNKNRTLLEFVMYWKEKTIGAYHQLHPKG